LVEVDAHFNRGNRGSPSSPSNEQESDDRCRHISHHSENTIRPRRSSVKETRHPALGLRIDSSQGMAGRHLDPPTRAGDPGWSLETLTKDLDHCESQGNGRILACPRDRTYQSGDQGPIEFLAQLAACGHDASRIVPNVDQTCLLLKVVASQSGHPDKRQRTLTYDISSARLTDQKQERAEITRTYRRPSQSEQDR